MVVLGKITFVKKKVTFEKSRMLVRLTEKSISILSEIVYLYCAHGCFVVNPYAGYTNDRYPLPPQGALLYLDRV